jgi:flagella basal body P-ring formation protein FlgA
VAVPQRALAKGDIVKANDLRVRAPPEGRILSEPPAVPAEAAGMAVRRAVRAGAPLRAADLAKPELVQKNDTVMLHYEVPGIVISMRGKAVDSGAQGDMVGVLNVNSKRTIQGMVTGPGRVTVLAPTPARVAAAPQVRMKPNKVSVMSNRSRFSTPLVLAVASGLVGGCSALDRLKNVGEQPALSAIENPTAQPGYKPVQMPMPTPQPATYNPNSLWRSGSRAFFKDQRAMQVGDIMTVKVKITDKAARSRTAPSASRDSKEDSGITDFAAASC